ncbi:nuclear transport factor 2 family protein [Hymenobacter radiodurans]|uniref:nuclear transport factor 2 family protein n=1 Tax=Hymenobacter radiodurans TaxID=2496028 RepID=UPI001F1016C8|nr:nuclear transport factor 2 family protein [Hymenobacter radiodurans]
MQKHFLLLALLLLVLPVLSFAQNKKNMDAAKEVETLERQRFAAQVKKDYALLDKYFSEDLVYTHGSGKQDNKATYIQSIRDGKSVYDKIDVEALNVRVYNDGLTAVVNGTIVITSPPSPSGQPNLARMKYVVVQVKDPKKGWQVVLWQAQKQADVKS